jgi:hypothetical protein
MATSHANVAAIRQQKSAFFMSDLTVLTRQSLVRTLSTLRSGRKTARIDVTSEFQKRRNAVCQPVHSAAAVSALELGNRSSHSFPQ